MSRESKLQALYNYVKLVNPIEDISLIQREDRNYIWVSSGRDLEFKQEVNTAHLKIFCTDGENFAAYTYGNRPLCPFWLHDVFHVYRTPIDKVKDRLPEYEQKQPTTRLCRRFYILEPKEEGLFSND